ncbi:MAG: CDP-alcohol phosphatidyltransferase family protein [Candidatus Lokiarchaeota archaeon]|nr:CDP-alcohol phosphatidyltransferase family protein [Candidatus Lokiarchaeota archaeon]
MSEKENLTKKRQKQRNVLSIFIKKPVNYLVNHKISPNLLSYGGFLCSLLASIFLGFGFLSGGIIISWLPPFFIFFAGAFDIFDGAVARKLDRDNPSGAFLDSNLDRISDASIILGLTYGKLLNYTAAYILLFTTLMISYTRARAENEGVNMKGIGLMERADRIIIFIFALSIEGWFIQIYLWNNENYTNLFFTVFIVIYFVLLVITLLHRIIHTFQKLQKDKI